MKFRFLSFALLILAGCASPEYVAPKHGDLSDIDFYYPGLGWTNVVGVFEDGENCKGLKYAAYPAKTAKVSLKVRTGDRANFLVATNSPREGVTYQTWSHCSTALSFDVVEGYYAVHFGIHNGQCMYTVVGRTLAGEKTYPEMQLREYVEDSWARIDSWSYCKD